MNKRILKLAIPNIISNISVPLLGAVDTALVGHLEAAYYIGAIAVGTMIFNVVYWGFGFLARRRIAFSVAVWRTGLISEDLGGVKFTGCSVLI